MIYNKIIKEVRDTWNEEWEALKHQITDILLVINSLQAIDWLAGKLNEAKEKLQKLLKGGKHARK